MASGAFINPKALLLAAPLVSTTSNLWFAADQDFFLRIFTQPNLRATSNSLLPTYFTRFFDTGLKRVLIPLSVTVLACGSSIYLHGDLLQTRGSWGWYVACASLAAGHLAYVPVIAPSVRALVEEERSVEKSNNDHVVVLEEWLGINFVRMMTADIGAWACAVIAVTKTMGL